MQMKEKKGKERRSLNKEKIIEALTVFMTTAIILVVAIIVLLVMLQRDFERAEAQLTTDVTFSSPIQLWERLPDLQVFPWSKYHKYSTRELSQEEQAFLQEKKVAECMVDMVNYDDILIQDKDSAVSLIYANARKLLTDDDDVYYVWHQFQIEDIYLYVMVNLNGEIFSFRYATDIEYDGEEAINYVLDNYEDGESIHLHNDEANDFEKNKMLFVENVYQKLKEYENLDSDIFYQDVDLMKKHTQISKEEGCAILAYLSKNKYNEFIFLYLDSKTKKVSGYHLMLY